MRITQRSGKRTVLQAAHKKNHYCNISSIKQYISHSFRKFILQLKVGDFLSMQQDIRDIAYIDHNDVIGLNFIAADGKYFFRRHFRQGLRSHVMEILDPGDIEKEKSGVMINNRLHFPRARPKKVLRIFRARFTSLDEVLVEIERVKMTERFLTTEFVAQSTEIIVDYSSKWRKPSLLLCGLQEYVVGVVFDPWSLLMGSTLLKVLYDSLASLSQEPLICQDQWIKAVRHSGDQFVGNIRKMILQGGLVPDLAGVGNVLITPAGQIKLVDINNISQIVMDDTIRLDDKNYPVCDKSIEVLALTEEKLLDRAIDPEDPIYGTFLTAARKKQVKNIERQFSTQGHQNSMFSE